MCSLLSLLFPQDNNVPVFSIPARFPHAQLIIIIVSVTAATVSKARSNGTDSVRWILVGKTGYAVTDGYTSQALVASALANYVNSSGLIPTPSFVVRPRPPQRLSRERVPHNPQPPRPH